MPASLQLPGFIETPDPNSPIATTALVAQGRAWARPCVEDGGKVKGDCKAKVGLFGGYC